MTRKRDTQRSRVYAWEALAVQQCTGRSIHDPDFKTLDECIAFADPIWRRERGRLGLAGKAAPPIERPSWGQTSALAHASHRITLPRWARSRWVILHELAHRLTPDRSTDAGHGPRFVGCLIGLASRWIGYDASLLMRLADEAGVKYHVRTIGIVPVRGLAWHVERLLRAEKPMTAMRMAMHLALADGVIVNYKQVSGAALPLIRAGRARWLRGKLVPMGDLVPPAPASKPAVKRAALGWVALRDRAKPHGIVVERDGASSYWVTCSRWPVDECDDPVSDDPFEGDHWCASLVEAREKVDAYIAALAEHGKAA